MRWLLTICALMFAAYFALATTYNAATTSRTDVLAAVNLAIVPGDIVQIPAGTSSTYSSQIDITNAITIRGTGGNRTNQTGGRTMLINTTTAGAGLETPIFNIKSKADPGAKIEISDIYFQDQNLDWNSDAIDIPGAVLGGAETGGIFERAVVIHHCTFDSFAFGTKWDGAWGLDYSNEYFMCANSLRVKGFNNLSLLPVSNPEAYKWSSTNYVVFEDDYFHFIQWVNKDIYLGDSEWPANYMVRFCLGDFDRANAQNRVLDGFDMHGESEANGADPHVPLGPVLYKNNFNYTGNNTVNPNRFLDMRGGANSLTYSNVVTGDSQYVQYRDDPPGSGGDGHRTTNNWMWANSDNDGSLGNDFNSDNNIDGVVLNTHFFTNQMPSDFSQLAYPHPLRQAAGGGGGATHGPKRAVQSAVGGRRR